MLNKLNKFMKLFISIKETFILKSINLIPFNTVLHTIVCEKILIKNKYQIENLLNFPSEKVASMVNHGA